jgi:hypothetical protein
MDSTESSLEKHMTEYLYFYSFLFFGVRQNSLRIPRKSKAIPVTGLGGL